MADAPGVFDQLRFSFCADQHVIERILTDGDSRTVSKASGFLEHLRPEQWNYHQAA